MKSITVQTEVDIDDIVYEMSDNEKTELCRSLIESGYEPEFFENTADGFPEAETYTEEQLIKMFKDIWDSRMHINNLHIDAIRSKLRSENII